MRNKKQVFLILWALSVVGAFTVVPYVRSLVSEAEAQMSRSILVVFFNSAVLFGIVSWFGVKLAAKLNFNLKILYGESCSLKKYLFIPSMAGGTAAGASVLLLDRFFVIPEVLNISDKTMDTWRAILAAFYGGINEEVLSRLFLMLLIIYIGSQFTQRRIAIYSGIILSAILFGILHLPATAAITPLTLTIVFRALLLNGVGGLIFGFIFYKRGFEAAMLAHFIADIIIHVLPNLIY